MRKWIMLGVTVCLAVVLMFQGTGQAQKQPVGSIYLVNAAEAFNKDGDRVNLPILFTLFKDGVVVRSSELNIPGTNSGGVSNATWENLPVGTYELHCESLGFGKLVRKIAVAAGERAQMSIKTMPEKDETQGVGPTLFEMQRKIALLENENAALKERVATLEKAK